MHGVSQNDPGYPRSLTVPGQRVDEHPGPQDRLRQVRVRAGQPGERDEQVKSGRNALDASLGQIQAQRAEQGVAPGPLSLADQPDVLLELAARDQPGQHQLR
jgi:hypothetical protein